MREQIEPIIELVRADELTDTDLFRLKCIFEAEEINFAISYRKADYILINAEHEKAAELKELVKEIMNCNSYNCELIGKFKELTGKTNARIISYIWVKWNEEKEKIKTKEKAKSLSMNLEKQKAFQIAEKEKKLIRELFNFGFGTYDEKAKTDWNKAVKLCFAYGYVTGLKQGKKI